MPRSERSGALVEFDPEIERRLQNIGRRNIFEPPVLLLVEPPEEQEPESIMAEERTLGSYASTMRYVNQDPVRAPCVDANTFELKGPLISMVQNSPFYGKENEDANLHITEFLINTSTVKIAGVPDDSIRLRLFPFSLKDKARSWYLSLPRHTIITWDQLCQPFLETYFPPSKIAQLRNRIATFSQRDGESFYEAWERLKGYERLCPAPYHDFTEWLIIMFFYDGLHAEHRRDIDVASGGTIYNKGLEGARKLFIDMGRNHHPNQGSGRNSSQKQGGMYSLDQYNHLASQMETLTKKIENMSVAPTSSVNAIASGSGCDFGHRAPECHLLNAPPTVQQTLE